MAHGRVLIQKRLGFFRENFEERLTVARLPYLQEHNIFLVQF